MDIVKSAHHFLDQLFNDLEKNNIEIKAHWQIDHLCYRVETEERYQFMKSFFGQEHELLVESFVGGRLISTFKLKTPIRFLHWTISVVELPAPKRSKKVQEGFEHIEVVCDVPFADLEKKYSHLELDRGGLSKIFNQELEIVLGKRNIKFHHMSLEEVIKIELAESYE